MKNIILITAILFVIGFAFLPFISQAGDPHHEQNVTNTTIIINESYTHNTYKAYQGAALAISAARCDFGDAGKSLQVCVGLGQYGEAVGGTVGVGMVIDDVLWNGSISGENGEGGIGLGWTWHVR